MGIAVDHGQGRNERIFVVAQTVIGTGIWPAGTDAIRVLKTNLSRKLERKPRTDKRQSRDLIERRSSRVTAEWSIEKYLMTGAAAGTAPDDRDLWIAAFGKETVVGATSVTYSLARDPGTNPQVPSKLFSVVRHIPDAMLEHGIGCLLEECKINLSGEDAAKISFSGPARDVNRVGGVIQLASQASSGASSVTVKAGQGRRLYVGARIRFQHQSHPTQLEASTAGYEVTSIATDTIGISPTLASTILADAEIWPYTPASTVAGSPIDGVLGSLTIDGTTAYIESAEIVVKNNLVLDAQRYGSAYLEDANHGMREVTGSITMKLRRDQAQYLVDMNSYTVRDLALVAGTVAGSIVMINMDRCEFDTSDLDVPEDAEVATFTVPFVVLGSGTLGYDDNSINVVMT